MQSTPPVILSEAPKARSRRTTGAYEIYGGLSTALAPLASLRMTNLRVAHTATWGAF
jgi:hypothetical protein